MPEIIPEDNFRRTMSSLATASRRIFTGLVETTVQVGIGESLSVLPTDRKGLLLRVDIENEPSSSFFFAVRPSGQVDVVDERCEYIPIESLDADELIIRKEAAEKTAQALVVLSLNHP